MKRSGTNFQLLTSVHIIFTSIAEFQASQRESKDWDLSTLLAVRLLGFCFVYDQNRRKTHLLEKLLEPYCILKLFQTVADQFLVSVLAISLYYQASFLVEGI